MIIFACFRGAGQYSNLVIALKMCRRVFRPSGIISCIIRAVMRSEPGALSGFSCLITCLSSLRVKACSFPNVGYVLQVLFQLLDRWCCREG